MTITIVLNEKAYAEECLKSNKIVDKPFYTLSVIARYYYIYFGYKRKKIIKLLSEFIEKAYPEYEYNSEVWNNSIEKIAKDAGKYSLSEIDGIWITESELLTIENIHNKVLERLAFTLLCLAKLGNAKNEKNDSWVNYNTKEIFSLARISCNVDNRFIKLGELERMNLLQFAKRIDNLSCKVTYIDDNSKPFLFISDFRELGYEYMKYKGGKFLRCCECGILIRSNKNGSKKYCSSCRGYNPQKFKVITCVDCGKEFRINSKDNISCRCKECYIKHRNRRKIETQRIRRSKE